MAVADKGIDVRRTGGALAFRVSLKDSTGAKLTTGTTTLMLYELQSDGTLKSYDFNDNTFKTTALTTATLSMTHRTGNNGTQNTGVWTATLSTLTGFTIGAIYIVQVNNTGASPPDQEREFQYGGAEGDLAVTQNGTGVAEINSDVQFWKGSAAPNMPTNFASFSIDASGRIDVIKVNGTSQTARDLGAQLDAAISTRMAMFTLPTNFSALSISAGGKVAATVATGDGVDASTLLGRLTSARAGYLDNLNVGGSVASHADIIAINQSASKHLLLQTVGQYERPESGSSTYTIELRTFKASDGTPINADTPPTLAATGNVTGNLSANLSAVTNPATGVYRWTYTVASNATIEQILFDAAATIETVAYTLSCLTQVTDFVSATFTATDQSHLTAIFNKLPTNAIGDETLLEALLNAIKAKTDNLPATPAAVGSAMTLTAGERDAIAAALLDLAAGIESGLTLRQGLRGFAAALLGKTSGSGANFRDTNDTKNRIAATLSGSDRTAITLDLT